MKSGSCSLPSICDGKIASLESCVDAVQQNGCESGIDLIYSETIVANFDDGQLRYSPGFLIDLSLISSDEDYSITELEFGAKTNTCWESAKLVTLADGKFIESSGISVSKNGEIANLSAIQKPSRKLFTLSLNGKSCAGKLKTYDMTMTLHRDISIPVIVISPFL